MECRCDENILIREEWLEDVVYTRTDRAGGFHHIHVNQSLIKAVAALDHDYLAQNLTIKNEPQNCGELPEEDNWSESTLTADECTDLDDDSRVGVAHNSTSDGGVHYKILKREPYALYANAGGQKIDAHKNNCTFDTDGNNCVHENLIKKACEEHIDDATRIRKFIKSMGMSKTYVEDQWSDATLTAPEDLEEIDDGWYSEDGGIALSPGEFIEEVDGWIDDTHELDGYCRVQDKTIKEEQYGENDAKEVEGLLLRQLSDRGIINRKATDSENDYPRATVTEDNEEHMRLSPGEFIEEVYDGNVNDDKLSLSRAVNINELSEDVNTKEGLISDGCCTVEAKHDNSSSTADERALSTEKHLAKAESNKECAKGDNSVLEDYADYEEYSFSSEESTGESDYAADSDESWAPPGKRGKYKPKKDPNVCRACNSKSCTQRLLKCHKKSSASCKDSYGCSLSCGRLADGLVLNGLVKKHSEKSYQKTYSCNNCSYTSQHSSNFKRHTRVHSGEKPFVCSMCKYAARTRCDLKKHVNNMHSGTNKKNNVFVCDPCGYKCDSLNLIRSHLQNSKTCQFPYLCVVCNKSYWGQHALNNHMKKHSGIHSCDMCSHNAQSSSHLKAHKASHTA